MWGAPRSGHVGFVHRGAVHVWSGYRLEEAEYDTGHLARYDPVLETWDVLPLPPPVEPVQLWPAQVSGAAVEVIGGRFAVFVTGFVLCQDMHAVEPHTNRVLVLDLAPPMRWVPTSYIELEDGIAAAVVDMGDDDDDDGGAAVPDPEVIIEAAAGRLPARRDKIAMCQHNGRLIVFGGWGPASEAALVGVLPSARTR
jgi:hypothetical protein